MGTDPNPARKWQPARLNTMRVQYCRRIIGLAVWSERSAKTDGKLPDSNGLNQSESSPCYVADTSVTSKMRMLLAGMLVVPEVP